MRRGVFAQKAFPVLVYGALCEFARSSLRAVGNGVVPRCLLVIAALCRHFAEHGSVGVVPKNTHMVSETVGLGLLRRKGASMEVAQCLTATMRAVFPDDPLKGDFALFGLGVDTEAEPR